jgi:hypothetical protein
MLDDDAPDGALPPVIGVRNIQVFRSSRDVPEMCDGKGWTYNHHMDLACWRGRLYVAWDNGEKDEDTWPAREVYSTSEDGVTWSAPKELFPQGVSTSLRMYFFHAKNDRMLAIAGMRWSHEKLQEELKRGAVVREIKADHSLGDVFTLIADERVTNAPPMFSTSGDKPFVEACQQLLANKPFLETQDYGVLLGNRKMKWHDPANSPVRLRNFGKAISFFHRKDGALVGIGKQGWTIVSTDEGDTWSQPIRPRSLVTGNAKVWGTHTSDGRYALVYNPKPNERFPLAMISGDDGITFKDMRIVHGEVPRQRYPGLYKSLGPQYVRGISEWASDHSRKDDSLWVVYSVNKEDIWVSRIPIPAQTSGWSTYSPRWAPASVGDDGKTVKLEDRDPYDYAKATYCFPESKKIAVSFQLVGGISARPTTLKLDFLDNAGKRAFQMSLPDAKLSIQIDADAIAGTYTMLVDGKATATNQPLSEKIEQFQRLTFYTDEYRGLGKIDAVPAGSDKPLEPARFEIRSLSVR